MGRQRWAPQNYYPTTPEEVMGCKALMDLIYKLIAETKDIQQIPRGHMIVHIHRVGYPKEHAARMVSAVKSVAARLVPTARCYSITPTKQLFPSK